MTGTDRIYGEKIFFNFIEVPYSNIDQSGDFVQKIKSKKLDGFIMKDVFNTDEVSEIKHFLNQLSDKTFMPTPSGKIFPAPFATITDTGERLNGYYSKMEEFDDYKINNQAVKKITEKLAHFFKSVAQTHMVSIPHNKIKYKEVAPGTFRLFYPNMGGLHVHCGNLFQAESMFFYSLIKEDIDMDHQLSYFLVLQESEKGGELSIYDMLWDDVKRKESPENNEFVIDDKGNHIYLKDIESFAVKPKPGDILIFSGGSIWHRVEDIKGSIPRITFGGFLNFSKDNKELYYWS